jgi:hypothetical protein
MIGHRFEDLQRPEREVSFIYIHTYIHTYLYQIYQGLGIDLKTCNEQKEKSVIYVCIYICIHIPNPSRIGHRFEGLQRPEGKVMSIYIYIYIYISAE